ncbi:MAG: hypothetical protein M1830_005731 [Pleopsidium flavum]|nr:MAG: hypothetical protein M1830_005731 [Pleopsidium flavum]
MSNPSLKSSVSAIANKPKALLAAERKKEQDAKEAQRKLEQKREIERKRAAQQEEARRQEQQQRREAERQREKERAISIEEPKKIAQKQAIEKRRLENAKKAEQHRNPQRPGNDLQEKAQPAPAPHRGELGNTRPTSRMNSVQDFNRVVAAHPLPNVAKPAKRPAEDESFQRPGLTKAGAASQANDAKRRRTDDEEVQEVHTRPTMAPPIRQSNIRKDAPKPSIFSHGYTSAPPPPSIAHAAPSLLKSTTNNQFQQINQQQQMQMQSSKPVHPMDMANRVTGKIPFAEAPNPPHPAYRTPLPSKQPAAAAAKSSPIYPNGDSIELPEIATDSEDEDSDDDRKGGDAFAPPDWANSPQLREILEQQQSVDPDKIFGPIAPPQMEKMFTNKDRHHRFRSRTSSANWSGPDRLTEEEIRSDAAAREKMRRQGGWTYGL